MGDDRGSVVMAKEASNSLTSNHQRPSITTAPSGGGVLRNSSMGMFAPDGVEQLSPQETIIAKHLADAEKFVSANPSNPASARQEITAALRVLCPSATQETLAYYTANLNVTSQNIGQIKDQITKLASQAFPANGKQLSQEDGQKLGQQLSTFLESLRAQGATGQTGAGRPNINDNPRVVEARTKTAEANANASTAGAEARETSNKVREEKATVNLEKAKIENSVFNDPEVKRKLEELAKQQAVGTATLAVERTNTSIQNENVRQGEIGATFKKKLGPWLWRAFQWAGDAGVGKVVRMIKKA